VGDEHIKRVDWVGRVLLPCDLSNFMGDAMNDKFDYLMLGYVCGMLTCFFVLKLTGAI
jgi:hypothetical protein